MAEVHPTAILEGEITLADDCIVGPNCVFTGPITIEPGCKLIGSVYLQGPLTIGADNVFYPFCCIGFAPQHKSYDPAIPGLGTVIGNGNVFRESVTVHRAFTEEHPTTIGDRNWFMSNSHVGHDTRIDNDCVITQGAVLGGHCHLGDRVVIGGLSGMHQHTRAGRGAMLGGSIAAVNDVPPWFTMTSSSVCTAVNLIGMRRSGMTREQIETVRWVFNTMYRQRKSMPSILAQLKSRRDDPLVEEYIAFIESSKRGLCGGPDRPSRK